MTRAAQREKLMIFPWIDGFSVAGRTVDHVLDNSTFQERIPLVIGEAMELAHSIQDMKAFV